jgi:hypothetical protein
MSGESGDDLRIVSRLENLQTGTGTVQRTAISTVASTAVIFSLVDRSMASSERDANLSAAPYAASRAYAVTVITLRPAASRVYRLARLSALAGGGAFGSGAGFGSSETADRASAVFCLVAASSLASAARSGSRRGAWGYGAPDCRCHRGQLVGGEVNCRHGPDIIGRHLSSKERVDIATRRRGARFPDLVALRGSKWQTRNSLPRPASHGGNGNPKWVFAGRQLIQNRLHPTRVLSHGNI